MVRAFIKQDRKVDCGCCCEHCNHAMDCSEIENINNHCPTCYGEAIE